MKQLWRIWAKALGEKTGATDRESDLIAGFRTAIVPSYIVTNCSTIAGVVRHWN
jgi:ABC-type microcin C transport system permease subunit YejE